MRSIPLILIRLRMVLSIKKITFVVLAFITACGLFYIFWRWNVVCYRKVIGQSIHLLFSTVLAVRSPCTFRHVSFFSKSMLVVSKTKTSANVLFDRSIPNALITLFQLLSLDKWRTVLNDSYITSDDIIAALYIFSWVIFGSFVVKNLFIGILGKLRE